MVAQQLGPLLDHDAESKSPLLPTLRAYLDADGHQPTTAAACFIHVSTLKYRLKKVRELLGRDLSDPEVRFQLRLAFKLMDLLEALGVDGPGGAAAERKEIEMTERESVRNEPFKSDGGRSLTWGLGGGNAKLIVHATGPQTGLACTIAEHVWEPGDQGGFHAHMVEDEAFFVIEGEITVDMPDEGET